MKTTISTRVDAYLGAALICVSFGAFQAWDDASTERVRRIEAEEALARAQKIETLRQEDARPFPALRRLCGRGEA